MMSIYFKACIALALLIIAIIVLGIATREEVEEDDYDNLTQEYERYEDGQEIEDRSESHER